MTDVAVGVPVWNGERFLEACVAALLAQSRRPDEIIISDNASTDRSSEVAHGIAATEPTVRVVSHAENIGAAGNFNNLVGETDAELFAWLPHDDLWSADLLAQMIEAHAEPGVAIAYGRPTYIDERGEPDDVPVPAIWTDAHDAPARLRELFRDPVRSHLHVCNPVLGMMRRDQLVDTGLIRPFGGSDKVLIVEMALRGRLVPVEAPFHRRRHPLSSVQANPDDESRRRWFDPDAAGPALPTSRLGTAFARSVRDAPLGVADRMRCAAIVARWAVSDRRARVIAGEAREWLGYRSGRLAASRRD